MQHPAGWLLICIVVGGCEYRTGETIMANQAVTESAVDFDDALREEPLRVSVKPIEIHPVAKPPAPVTVHAPQRGRGAPRAFFSESLNSRTGGEIGTGPWQLRWKANLKPGLNAAFVLQAADRILLPGEYEWQLFNREGMSLATGARGAGEVVMHETGGLFYLADPSGTLAAQQIADGKRKFAMNVFSGKNFRRSLILPHASRLLVVSVEYLKQPHSNIDPNFSAIEVYELGASPQVNQYGLLTSAEPKARLTRASPLLLAAACDEAVIVAVENRLLVADWDLKVKGVLSSKFTPVALSLDEEARIYLLLRSEGKQALWIVTPQGERLAAYEFASDVAPILAPPAIGYDHRAYVVAGERQFAISPGGKLEWQTSTPGEQVKLSVTADNQLLAAVGNQVVAFDRQGEARELITVDGAALVTPPVVTAQGEILVASPTQLYCLERPRAGTPSRTSNR